jgi:hypothetical protein
MVCRSSIALRRISATSLNYFQALQHQYLIRRQRHVEGYSIGSKTKLSCCRKNGAALQQNTAMLQQGAAALETLRQGFTAQQTTLKAVSNQLSSLFVRVDSLQNALIPLTTSSIPQPNRARFGQNVAQNNVSTA